MTKLFTIVNEKYGEGSGTFEQIKACCDSIGYGPVELSLDGEHIIDAITGEIVAEQQINQEIIMAKYTVIEDNGGGLHLFVRQGRQNIYSHSGYEHNPGQLTQDLDALDAGDDPTTWEGNEDQAQTEAFRPSDLSWEVVATSQNGKRKLYPARMGRSAQIEFSVSDEDRDRAWAAAQLGSARSARKRKSSANNGRKGGRPPGS